MQGRGSAQKGSRPKRGSAQKEDQENKLNPHSAAEPLRKNLDQEGEAQDAPPALVDPTSKDELMEEPTEDLVKKAQQPEQEIKKEEATTKTRQQQPRRGQQQRQVDPQLFQDLPPHATALIRKRRTRSTITSSEIDELFKEGVGIDEDFDEDFVDVDFATAAADEENEEQGGDMDYHPPVLKRHTREQARGASGRASRGAFKGRKRGGGAPHGVNKGRVGKKAFDGAKELEDALNDFSIGNKKNNHRGEKNKSTFAAGAPSSLPDLATAQGQGQDFLSLSAQVQALLAHTALLEARINQKDGQIASLTAAVASLCQTAPIQQQQQQQQQNNGNGNGRGNDSAVPGLSQRELQLEEFVNKLDHNIAACGANLNQHSKVISEIKAELNAANQNAVQLSTHFLGFKEALRNLDHLYITQASALARFEAEVADVKNYFKEHQTEIKKKVEAAVKVAEGARTSWDSLSPRAAPATNMF